MINEKYLTVPQLAKLIGISRIAVYKRVKKGQIPAVRIGRTYVITDRTLTDMLGGKLTQTAKRLIDGAVRKTVLEYGEVLKKLGRE